MPHAFAPRKNCTESHMLVFIGHRLKPFYTQKKEKISVGRRMLISSGRQRETERLACCGKINENLCPLAVTNTKHKILVRGGRAGDALWYLKAARFCRLPEMMLSQHTHPRSLQQAQARNGNDRFLVRLPSNKLQDVELRAPVKTRFRTPTAVL